MVIGVDGTTWSNERGYGRFTRELLSAMVELFPQHTFVLFADPKTADGVDLEQSNLHLVPVAASTPPGLAACSDGRRSIRDMFLYTRAVARRKPDVFFSPSVYAYFPLPPGLAAVVCIHDAIPERFPDRTLATRRSKLFWRAKVRLAIRQCRIVLAPSRYAAGELSTFLGIPPARIRITGEAPSAAFRPSGAEEIAAAAAAADLPPDARWFLYVGGLNPHKNVDVLVAAYSELLAEPDSKNPYLLFVGPTDDRFHAHPERIRQLVAEYGIGERVRWLGFLPDDELRHLYSGALAVVLPSESEGFGLPAVEAAACGTPAIATTESPLPDLLAGGGIFVRPGDLDALLRAMRRLSEEGERQTLGRVAQERMRSLTWEKTARATLDALAEAAA